MAMIFFFLLKKWVKTSTSDDITQSTMTLSGFFVVLCWTSEDEEAILEIIPLIEIRINRENLLVWKKLDGWAIRLHPVQQLWHLVKGICFIRCVKRCLSPCEKEVNPNFFNSLWIVFVLTPLLSFCKHNNII